jgi:hypothetical protein
MTFVRIVASAMMLTLFAAGATTLPTKSSGAEATSVANVVLRLLGASTTAEARMCDPACRYRCC